MDNNKPDVDDFDYKQAFIEQKLQTEQLEAQLKELKEKLHHNDKLASLGYIAAGVHHELTNPLSVSTANLQLIKDHVVQLIRLDTLAWQIIDFDAVDTEYQAQRQFMSTNNVTQELTELLEETKHGLKQVADINNSVKAFSISSDDDVPLSDINQCINSALTAVKNEIKYTVSIHQRLDSSLPPVPFHFGKIQQVLVNLLLNAKQAIVSIPNRNNNIWLQSRAVTIDCEQYIEVSITDDGVGVTDDIRSRIFEPFFTTKSNSAGTGLGLSVSHDIVQQHNGTLSLNEDNQSFTQFVLRLPIESSYS